MSLSDVRPEIFIASSRDNTRSTFATSVQHSQQRNVYIMLCVMCVMEGLFAHHRVTDAHGCWVLECVVLCVCGPRNVLVLFSYVCVCVCWFADGRRSDSVGARSVVIIVMAIMRQVLSHSSFNVHNVIQYYTL